MDKQPAEKIFLQIKADIAAGRLPIGETLKQQQLSELYGVSRIPIRDILVRLKNEGWLVQSGKRGVMIPPFTAQEAEDLYMMRMYLEPLILAHSIKNINHQTLGKARDLLATLEHSRHLSIQQQGELNWHFHACLYEPAERPTLFNTIAALHQQCSRYIGFHNQALEYHHTSQKQHYDIMNAIELKRVSKAKTLLKAHISDAGEQLVEYLRQRNESDNPTNA